MAALLSLRGYAKHRGCNLHAVQKAIADGRIATETDDAGKVGIDPEKADQAWEENTDQAKQRGDEKAPAPASPYQTARATREYYRSQLDKIEYQKAAGQVVSAAEVKARTFRTARITRDAVLNVPSRVADQLASETDPAKVYAILERELRLALEALADGDPDAKR